MVELLERLQSEKRDNPAGAGPETCPEKPNPVKARVR